MAYRALKNHRAFGRIGLAALALIGVGGGKAYSYQIHINNSGTDIIGPATSLSSVFGEARPSTTKDANGNTITYVGVPNRFHKGVDITAVNGNPIIPIDPNNPQVIPTRIYSIEDGAVSGICLTSNVSCAGLKGSNAYVKVQSLADPNRTFVYVHITPDPSISVGEIVTTTMTIGTTLLTHLHLNQVETISGVAYDLNPLTNGLEFSDPDLSAFDSELGLAETQITDANGVEASGDLIPVFFAPGSSGPDGLNASITALSKVSQGNEFAGDYVVDPRTHPVLDIVVSANGSQTLGRRKGLYRVGATLAWAGTPGNFLYQGSLNLEFDSLLDGDPSTGVNTVYKQRNADSDAYFATNSGTPCHQFNCSGQTSDIEDIDISDPNQYPSGVYKLCANLSVLSDSEYESDEQPECIPLIISRGPTIALTQRGAPGTVLSTSPVGARMFV